MIFKSHKRTAFTLIGLMLLGACSKAPEQSASVQSAKEQQAEQAFTGIRGKLLGANGKPMAMAQVQLQILGDMSQKQPLQIEVAADGSYILDLEAGKQYGVTFIGLAHEQISYVIAFNQAQELGMTVNLDYLPMIAEPKNVNLFIFSMAKEGSERPRFERMTLGDDGRYTVSVDVPQGKFRYKIDGVSHGMHLIGDPTTGPYEASAYGDFLTLVNHAGGEFTVNYQHQYSANPYSDAPLRLMGDWGEQQLGLTLQQQYGRLLSEQRIASKSDQTGEFRFAEGIEQMAKWRKQYQGSEHEAMILGMSTAIKGQEKQIFKDAFERFDGKTPWLYLPEVVYSDIMTGAATFGINANNEQTATQAYLDFYINNKDKFNHYIRHFADDEKKGQQIAVLAHGFKKQGEKDNYRELYTQLQQRYSHINNYDFYIKMLAPPAVAEGQSIPDFSITALNNPETIYTQNSFKGKLLLIDFWATWCAPCIKEMPDLHHAYQDYQAKGFEILSLSADINASDVTDFTSGQWKMPWQHAFLDGGEHPMVQDFGIVGYPAAYLVDETGVVIASGDKVRGKMLLETLNGYFAKK